MGIPSYLPLVNEAVSRYKGRITDIEAWKTFWGPLLLIKVFSIKIGIIIICKTTWHNTSFLCLICRPMKKIVNGLILSPKSVQR